MIGKVAPLFPFQHEEMREERVERQDERGEKRVERGEMREKRKDKRKEREKKEKGRERESNMLMFSPDVASTFNLMCVSLVFLNKSTSPGPSKIQCLDPHSDGGDAGALQRPR